MKEPEITYDELMKELEKYRHVPLNRRTVLDIMTEEMKMFLYAAREHTEPISYAILADVWEEKFGKRVGRSQLRERYMALKKIGYKPKVS